jgi:hypothetical protein
MTTGYHAVLFFFYFDTGKKVTTIYCHRFLCSNNTTKEKDGTLSLSFFCLNTTREEGDGNKMSSPFLLQQHHRKI